MNDDVIAQPVIEATPEPRRGGARYAVLGLGVVALLVLGGFLVQALTGGGGADSPEGALRSLADAISDEDVLGALAVIAPDEVGTLDRIVDAAAQKAKQYEIVDDAARPFAGFDLQVSDLALETEEMAPGFVKVSITGGAISSATHPEQFSELVRSKGEIDEQSRSVDLDQALCADGCPGGVAHPFAVAVQQDGRWYVSAAYTAFEYWRVSEHLPEPDLGSARELTGTGAETPEAAVGQLVDAMSTLDMERAGALVPPGELGAAYDYRAAIKAAVEQHDVTMPLYETKDLRFETARNGDVADVSVESGTLHFGSPDEGEETTVTFKGDGCADVTMRYDARFQASGEEDLAAIGGTLNADDVDQIEDLGATESSYNTCDGTAMGAAPLVFAPLPQSWQLAVRTVERDGRWYVSPMGTIIDALDESVQAFDQRSVYMMFGMVDRIEPNGSVAIGGTVKGETTSIFDPDVWTLQGHGGDELVLRADTGSGTDDVTGMGFGGFFPQVYGPDGEELMVSWFGAGDAPTVALPADGEYRIVLMGAGKYTLHVEKADFPELPVPGSVSGTLELPTDPFGDPMSSMPTPYTVAVPEGATVKVTVTEGAEAVWLSAEPVSTNDGSASFAFGSSDSSTTLDGSVSTRWHVSVSPNYEKFFGIDGEPTTSQPAAPVRFTLTAEVVGGG